MLKPVTAALRPRAATMAGALPPSLSGPEQINDLVTGTTTRLKRRMATMPPVHYARASRLSGEAAQSRVVSGGDL